MDSIRFDRLSRLVATRTTRRAGLGLLAALGLLGLSQTPAAALKCTLKCRPCRRCKWVKTPKIVQRCVPKPLGTACPGGSCRFGTCICREGYRPCKDRGGCIPNDVCCTYADCPEGATCQAGTCVCPPGTAPCGGRCCPHATARGRP